MQIGQHRGTPWAAPWMVSYGDLSAENRTSRFIRKTLNGWYSSGRESSSAAIGSRTSRSKTSPLWASQNSLVFWSSRSSKN